MEEEDDGGLEEEGGIVDVDAEDKLSIGSGGDVGDVVWAEAMNSCCWAFLRCASCCEGLDVGLDLIVDVLAMLEVEFTAPSATVRCQNKNKKGFV